MELMGIRWKIAIEIILFQDASVVEFLFVLLLQQLVVAVAQVVYLTCAFRCVAC